MKNKKLLILVLFLLFFSFKVSAVENCSTNGYTVININGIFTDEKDAVKNKDSLRDHLPPSYNNQKIIVDYLYNSTHIAGAGDIVDVVNQGFFNSKSDFDLVEMLNDASSKIKTQKLLLVGYSQGNFYANNFYDKVTDKEGGIPNVSIGTYSVATPADRVAGNGQYLTSDSDKVISTLFKSVKNIMNPNTHIELQDKNDYGHSFTDVYLKYKSSQIVSDIKSSLGKLSSNQVQNTQNPCISPEEITLGHKINKVVLGATDFVVNNLVKAEVFVFNKITGTVKSIASLFGNTSNKNLASAGNFDNKNPTEVSNQTITNEGTPVEIANNTEVPTQSIPEEVTENINIEDTPIIDNSPEISNSIPVENPIPIINNGSSSISGGGGSSSGGTINNNTGDSSNSYNSNNNDITAPAITLSGESVLNVILRATYTDLGATALDETDGDIAVVTTGTVDTSTLGIYILTYTATDKSLNVATKVRTVNVIENEIVDIVAPIVTLSGESVLNVILRATYTDLGATALDETDGDIAVVTTGTVDTSTLGIYILTYTATDKSLNVATKVRTVNVIENEIVDIVAPIVTLSGEDILNVNLGAIYTDLGATALDETDGDIAVVTTGTVDTSTLGTYTLTYTATDKSLNIATRVRIVNVIKNETADIIAPVITLFGKNIITIPLSIIYTDTGATALDETDGVVAVTTTGKVDAKNIGTYILTYTASDKANNIATLTRTINVVNTNPVVSTTATLSLPNAGTYAGDGLEPSRGRNNLTPFIFQVIYTDINNNAPKNVKLTVNNLTTGISLPGVVMNKITPGADVLSDENYSNGEIYTISSLYDLGDYNYYFTASDINENTAKAEDNNILRFSSINSSYTYLPKYTFGLNNGDGNDWQVWSFNGSNVYDWTDTYLDKYLREQFKIQTYPGGYWCSQCLQRGIFNHDPQTGFETSDLVTSGLEGNPQNNMVGQIYNVTIQWDSTGYSYTVSHNSIVDSTGRTDVANMNNDLWVGWDGSFNNFTGFPSGGWQGVVAYSPMERTGGGSMVLQPYPVYNSNAISTPDPIPDPTPVLSSKKLITSFNLESLTPVVAGEINNTDNTIKLIVPYQTVITSLVPTIIISEKSSILPSTSTASDFTNSVSYTVKAEDGSTSTYVVTVIVSPNPNPEPDPDSILPIITSYTLGGAQNSITTNPITNNLSIVLNSSKNVNWMSIKIEKEGDSSLYRMYQSGDGCVDGTNTCTKVWDGILSSGGLLQNGNYKVKVHIKDNKNNEYEDYLPSIITVNAQ